MLIKSLMVGPFGVNCYVLGCEKTRQAIIIDPGDEPKRILDIVAAENLTVDKIVNTHCHIDHVAGVNEVRKSTGARFLIHKDELPVLQTISQQAMLFGLRPFTVDEPDDYVRENDEISFGEITLRVLETPGHSPGSISLAGQNAVFVGDVLFAGSVGRTDLIGGDFTTLKKSIMEKIVPLGDQVVVYSGHGPETTVGREVQSNPFLTP